MNRELNKPIAVKNFGVLVLDYEWPADGYAPAGVSCRVLLDGYYAGRIAAVSQAEAINKFYSNNWR